jgi:hypothetical protein
MGRRRSARRVRSGVAGIPSRLSGGSRRARTRSSRSASGSRSATGRTAIARWPCAQVVSRWLDSASSCRRWSPRAVVVHEAPRRGFGGRSSCGYCRGGGCLRCVSGASCGACDRRATRSRRPDRRRSSRVRRPRRSRTRGGACPRTAEPGQGGIELDLGALHPPRARHARRYMGLAPSSRRSTSSSSTSITSGYPPLSAASHSC